ncbi:30S ribosomal protein S6e [Candidatus Micrarchaeota archaeon]|nr:30S ribosomal protein S6e [Candidatus Micrarchaeota archaeon]MBD3417400.1 30S ribosomal protein S6e [Candidatus Micrarchaeota archaeon]
MKLVVSDPKTGRTVQIDIPEEKRTLIVGKRIGQEIAGDDFGLAGYTLKLTGGSDDSGFPMKSTISGARKIRSLVSAGPGFNPKRKGQRKKKMLRGDTYSLEVTQVNSSVLKPGAQSLDQLFPKEEKPEEGEKK